MNIVGLTFALALLGGASACTPPIPAQACQGDTLTLQCNEGEVVDVMWAQYDRTTQTVCEAGPAPAPGTCSLAGAMGIVQGECNGNPSCTFVVGAPFLADPCPTFPKKVLNIRWRCCKDPDADDHTDMKCERREVPVRPVVGDCQALNTIQLGRCDGGCPSVSTYQFGTSNVQKKCTCCVPTAISRRTETLKCSHGGSITASFLDVKDCDCKPCEDDPPKPDCHVTELMITPTIKDCVGVRSVDIGQCHGGCDSSAGYAFGSTKPRQMCDCCVPIKSERRKALLQCKNGKWISRDYYKVLDCDCRPCTKRPVGFINLVSAEDATAVKTQKDAAIATPVAG